MKLVHLLLLAFAITCACQTQQESTASQETTDPVEKTNEWITLFDGTSLEHWKHSENEGSFSLRDGMLVVDGERSHLFYDGPVGQHNFKNFEFKAEVMTQPGANSGIYFHTEFQQDGWPSKGYEIQVNNSHTDWRRTGSLYGIEDLREVPTVDNEWYTEYIKVEGKSIVVKLNGETVIDFVEPEGGYEDNPGRKISSGTFCLQAHDPKSVVYYRNIQVRPLP